jgi:hypothetical protein
MVVLLYFRGLGLRPFWINGDVVSQLVLHSQVLELAVSCSKPFLQKLKNSTLLLPCSVVPRTFNPCPSPEASCFWGGYWSVGRKIGLLCLTLRARGNRRLVDDSHSSVLFLVGGMRVFTHWHKWVCSLGRKPSSSRTISASVRAASSVLTSQSPGCIGRHNSTAYRRDTQFGCGVSAYAKVQGGLVFPVPRPPLL